MSEGFKKFDPDLERRLDEFSRDEARTIFDNSITNEHEYGKSGEINEDIGGCKVHLSYHQTKLERELKDFEKQPIYEVERLTVTGPDGICFELSDLFSQPPVILFAPTANNTSGAQFDDCLLVAGDILNPYRILGLCHEAGHYYLQETDGNTNYRLAEIRKKIKTRQTLTENEAKDFMSNERGAWAFALSKLKGFIGPNLLIDKKQAEDYIHRLA